MSSSGKSNPMTKEAASNIQSTQVILHELRWPILLLTKAIQAKGGHDTGSGSFAARAQSAGDRNTNASNQSGGDQSGGQKK